MVNNLQILKLQQVINSTALSRSSIYKRINEGTFPRQIPLGGRKVGWEKSEVQEWLQKCIDESRKEG